MTDTTKPKVGLRLDDFIEDVFGLNIRGLKSVWVLFVRPRDYFEAALEPDWKDRFTPSIRLWLSIMAVMFFFKFFWAGSQSATMTFTEQLLQQQAEALPAGLTAREAALRITKWYIAFLPFTSLIGYALLGLVWPFWGRKAGFTLRQRLVFAVIIPSTVLNVVFTLLMGLASMQSFLWIMTVAFSVSLLADSLTAWRGAFAHLPVVQRLWRTAALVVALNVSALVMTFIAQYIALNLAFAGW